MGFAAFFVLDKTMRVLSTSADTEFSSNGHSHGHTHNGLVEGKSTSVSTSHSNDELRSRKSPSGETTTNLSQPVMSAETNASMRLSAYLNLFGDFTHNITDGLAMAASFYSSPALGAVTTIATFCHEIPHEVSHVSLRFPTFPSLLSTSKGSKADPQ